MIRLPSKWMARAQASAWILIVALVGCSGEFMKPPILQIEHPRATRMGLIDFFTQAHEERDIEAYAECLHPDYTFHFWEEDVAHPCWDWSVWIGKPEDLAITANMFESENVTSIRAVFTNLTTDGDSGSWHAEAVPDGEDSTYTVFWAEFYVDMPVFVETGEEQFYYWVNGKATIYVCADPDDEGLWTIWKIEDKGNRNRVGGEEISWSEIKAIFRP